MVLNGFDPLPSWHPEPWTQEPLRRWIRDETLRHLVRELQDAGWAEGGEFWENITQNTYNDCINSYR